MADPSVRVQRAVACGMDEDDARLRLATHAIGYHVIVNNGTMDELRAEVGALWGGPRPS